MGQLIERSEELAQIDRLLSAAAAGEGGALLLEGPPGIGKTVLLDAARARAARRGVTTLTARGGELEDQFPYGVVRQLFERALHAEGAAERRKLLSGAARLAAPLVTGGEAAGRNAAGNEVTGKREIAEGERIAGMPPDAAFGVTHGLYWLTVNFAQRTPLLIAVDDAHWADVPSLRFLVYLSRRLEGAAVALLVSLRASGRGASSELALPLAAADNVEVARPAALSEHGVARLLAARLGGAPDERFVTSCRATTGGVPFLVLELIAALQADGITPTAEQAGRVRELGPRTVAHATLARLGRMPDGCLALARAVAVLASMATLPRVARLGELHESVALSALDALVEAGLLRAGPAGVEFAHPIVRAAVYDELAPGVRSELHLRAARLLADEGAELDAVAAQLLASEPTGSLATVATLQDAAALALRRGAPENAIAYLTRALAEGCERELRATLSFALAGAARSAGRPGLAIKHYEETRRLAAEPALRNSAALELAAALAARGEWERADALAQSAIDDLGDRNLELRLRLESLRAGIVASNPTRVAEFDARLPTLEALVAQSGLRARSLALLLAGVGAWRGHDGREVRSLVAGGVDANDPLAAGADAWALSQGLAALVLSEELTPAHELAGALLAQARALGSITAFVLGNTYRGFVAARRGELGAAEEALRAALGPSREARVNFVFASQLWCAMDVILERPQGADLAASVCELQLGPLAGVHAGAMVMEVRGRVRHAAGEATAAIDDLRAAGEVFTALGMRNPNASSWRSALALMLVARERREATRLVEEELADARRVGHARAVGVALRAKGLLEGSAQGAGCLEEAVRVLERSPARLEHARALVELGASLRRAGTRAAARGPLRAGLDMAVAAGAVRLGERARAELAASGGRPRRLRISGRDALTPSELRVARLVAEGRTNNDVAQVLFVTPKTVDTHLTRAYAKLGISSRRDLAAALETPTDRYVVADAGV